MSRFLAPALPLACCATVLLTAGSSGAGSPAHRPAHRPPHVPRGPLTKATWLSGVEVTEYWPAPERWFVGRRVLAPGLSEPHRIDWLYSARGLSMEGDGIGLDGRSFHIAAPGQGGWINAQGAPTVPGPGGWNNGSPFWRAGGYWLTHARQPTFPLESGSWSAGTGSRYVPLPGVSFTTGQSLPLRYYRSVAVDPRLIPIGSRLLIPAYAHITPTHGWFVAADTGGAIQGRHLDVYRPPPDRSTDGGRLLTAQRVYVIPPHAKRSPAPAPRPTTGPSASPGSAQAPAR